MHKEKYYRAELDGLRGVIIILLVLYHTNVTVFKKYIPGSFITIDIFFVISGYLIARGIIKSGENFSYKDFYKRRVKKLYPALFTTVLLTCCAGFWIFTPGKVINLFKTAILSILPVSNIYYAFNTDYFDYKSQLEPFLHTWSLSLEEQFYLVIPFFLIFFIKKKPNLKVTLALYFILATISIGIAEYYLKQQRTSVYYLLPFRAHELLAGVLINFIPKINKEIKYFGEIMVLIGMSMLVYMITSHYSYMPYPGINSLLPTIGTFLIITFADKSRWIIRILKLKSLCIIGASSYVIYLLHWPIFLFYRYLNMRELELMEALSLTIFTVTISIIFWKYIESPIKKYKSKSVKEKIFLRFSLISASLMLIISGYIISNKGFTSRYPLSIQKPKSELVKERADYWESIHKYLSNEPDVLVVGNSHATDLLYIFIEGGSKYKYDLIDTSSECWQFVIPVKWKYKSHCKDIEKKILGYEKIKNLEKIIFHDYWWKYNKEKLTEFLSSVKKLTNAEIILVGPRMSYKESVVDLIQVANITGKDTKEFIKENELKNRIKFSKAAKADFKIENEIKFIDLLAVQCGGEYNNCDVFDEEGNLTYFDDTHLNIKGCRKIAWKLRRKHLELFE